MIALPPPLAPPPPFPLVVAQSSAVEFVAPGVERIDYRLTTNAGPVVIHVVVVDGSEPTIRFGAVLARDRLLSNGETVSSMAARTGAVAGINADYFDIGQTNQPLNVVVRDRALVRTPSQRATIAAGADRSIAIGTFAFTGSAAYDNLRVPLTGVNVWPPQGGASLLTPAYGALVPVADVTVARLVPLDTSVGSPGTYRVAAIGPVRPGPVTATLLALGPAALRAGPAPAVDDTVEIDYATQPDYADLLAAVGGGPLLVAGGAAVEDPFAPAPEERDVRFPLAGAALDASGSLDLIAVDGRAGATSIGLTRPEFGALMLGLGATSGLAFDSGGSATLVARILGESDPRPVNVPSDGHERPVADGLFVFSTAPHGEHPHLIVRPDGFSALAGMSVPLTGAIVDDGGHRIRQATLPALDVDPQPGSHVATVTERGGLSAEVAYQTVARVARLEIVPERPNPSPLGSIGLAVRGFDAAGRPVALGAAVWRADRGTIAAGPSGTVYRAADGNAVVTVSAGGASASTVVLVGSHPEPVRGFVRPPGGWRFATLPAGGPGAVTAAGEEVALDYDLTGPVRAAYANAAVDLPGEPLGLRLEVFGDGKGVVLRGAFVNRFGEKQLLTLAPRVDWQGWRTLTLDLPPSLNAPAKLTSLYVLPALAGPPVRAAGVLRFRAAAAVVRGSS